MKVCFFVGESIDERYFFPSLLQNQFQFTPLQAKNPFIYQKDNNLWFFPFPPKKTNPKGGKDRLKKQGTYLTCRTLYYSHKHLYQKGAEIVFLINYDTDGNNNLKSFQKEVKENVMAVFGTMNISIILSAVNKEIEAWYIAGSKEDFPLYKKISPQDLLTFNSTNVENIHDHKDFLKKLLDDQILGETRKIADSFGEHFDIDHAKARSKSFGDFWQNLEDNNLI